LSHIAPIRDDGTDPEVMEMLEGLLERAKEKKVTSVASTLLFADGSHYNGYYRAGGTRWTSLVGAASNLLFNLNKRYEDEEAT
jgi:hypothetical protein